MSKTSMVLIAAFAGLFILFNTAFIVNQTQQALVLRFGGEIHRVVKEPGLNFKLPFVDSVVYFEKRLLDYNAQPQEFITKDRAADVEERVVIDAFVRYRITDPVKFYQAVKTEENLGSRLNSIVVSNMRKIIAQNSLNDLLSERRSEIMQQIQKSVNNQATSETVEQFEEYNADDGNKSRRQRQGFGIEVVDVRIMRADLPQDISDATFERMKKNFTKEAQKFRAEGEEVALQIRSSADRERTELLAQAQKESETIRGEGDGLAAKIYADAFNQDPQFFEFYRSMQAYRKALNNDDTTLILSPDSQFLNQLD